MTRAALYIRVSTTEQASGGVSLEQQRALAERYCAERGWVLAGEYRDVMSGRKDNRPELKRLEADAQAGAFSVVLVYRTDRLARSIRKAMALMGELADRGVALVSMTEPLDLTSPMGRAIFALLAGWAEQESVNTGQRVSDAKRHQAAAGVWVSHLVPVGYRYTGKAAGGARLEADEEWAPLVRRIFDLYIGGMTPNGIAGLLNRECLSTPAGSYWRHDAIARIVHNEAYTGRVIANRWGAKTKAKPEAEWLRAAPSFQGLIDDATWQAARARTLELADLPSRARYGQTVNPWSGLLDCGGCGFRLKATTHRIGGKPYHYHRCALATCPVKAHVSRRWLDATVWPKLRALLLLATTQGPVTPEPAAPPPINTERETKRLLARIERAAKGYLAGALTLEQLQAEKAACESSIAQLASVTPAAATMPAGLSPALLTWEQLPDAEKGAVLRLILARGVVGAERTTLQIHYLPLPDWPETLWVANPRPSSARRFRS